jgi:hypothetical protein
MELTGNDGRKNGFEFNLKNQQRPFEGIGIFASQEDK